MRTHSLTLAVFAALAIFSGDAFGTDVTIGGSPYTLSDHPRLWMDGPAGTITARVKDPDGAGAGVAPQATDLNPAFVALKDQVRSCRSAPDYCLSRNEKSITLLLLAMDWYMDNSQADSLTAAKYLLNNVETWATGGFQFACVLDAYAACGVSSFADWPSWDIANIAQAYSIVRSEMSAGERTTFSQKLFNDDEAYYQDTCTNQIQQEAGATASFTAGSAAVTGTNLDGLTAGRKVAFRGTTNAVGWATIQTVNSASSLTLTGAPQYPLGGNFPTLTNGSIYEVKPWDSTTCGMTWFLAHHTYMASGVMNDYVSLNYTVAFTAVSSTITVSSTAGLPAAPFYLRVPGTNEIVKVTEVNGLVLSVDRAQFGTTAFAGTSPPRQMVYTRYLPTTGSGDPSHNLVIQKVFGHLLAGIALADDSARAREVVTTSADYWISLTMPHNKAMWTGIQQGGSTEYGPGRQLHQNMGIVVALKNIDAALDYSGGVWLDNFTTFWLMTSLPNATSTFVPWGQSDIAGTPAYHSQNWTPFQTSLFGEASDQSAYWNYWQRTVASQYTSGNLTSGSNERLIPLALLYWQESDTSTDYRSTLPTQQAFNVGDTGTTRTLNSWVSRTGYTASTDTVVFVQAWNLNYTSDHIGGGGPGGYKIYKGGWVFTENRETETHVGLDTNMLAFGATSGLKSIVQHQRVDIDRVDSGTGWAFARFNMAEAYIATTAVTRALRNLVHFKKAASPDYLVVYDDMATSSAKSLGVNLFFDKKTGETTTFVKSVASPWNSLTYVWTGPNRRLSTRVVLPVSTAAVSTYTSTTSAHKEYLCASADGTTCASTTSAEFLVVHKPSTSTSDTLPTTAALDTIDSDFVGVQISDATAPSVAVFAKAGVNQTSATFTTDHSGTGQYVVTGLEAGTYDVVRGGATTVVDDEVIGSDGTIGFESVSGAFAITRGGAVPAIEVTTTTLSNATRDQVYSATLEYTGGTPPVTWTVSAGTLCTGLTLTDGVISGTPTVSQTCNFTVEVEDDAAQTDTQDLSITVQTPPPTLTVITSPGSTSVVVTFGTATLAENQSCDVVVSSAAIDPGTGLPIGPVANTTSSSGPATRSVTLSGLAPSTQHTAQVTCGTVASGSDSFTTLPAGSGSTASWKYTVKPHANLTGRSVAKVSVEYNLLGSAADTETASCASGCTLTLPLLTGQLYELRHIWMTAADAVVATSRKGTVAVP